jgi:TolB-like protein
MLRILIKNYIIILLIMVFSMLSAQEDQPTAAILYFTGQGLTPQQTKSLRNRFSSSLASTERVSMIAQSKVAGALKKEGLGVSDCATDECAVRIGGALGVEYIITGGVEAEGNNYSITAKMLSVDGSTEKREESITYSGFLDGLNVQTEILAWNLLDMEAPPEVLMKVRKDYSRVGGKGLFGLKGLPTWMLWGGLGLVAAGGGAAIMIAVSDGGSDGTGPIGGPPDFPDAP